MRLKQEKRALICVLLCMLTAFACAIPAAAKLATNVIGDVDLNGKLGITDATFIQRELADIGTPFTVLQRAIGDVDGDGKLNIIDVTNIQRKLASLDADFRAEQATPLEATRLGFSSSYASGVAEAGKPVTLRATTDSIFRPVEFSFSVNSELIRDFDEDESCEYVFPESGSYYIKVSIRNCAGESLSFAVNFEVQGERPVIIVDPSAFEDKVLELINGFRAENGVAPLTLDGDLCMIAKLKNEDMVNNRYFDHYSETFGGYTDVLMEQYKIPYHWFSENLVSNAMTPDTAFEAWRDSTKGHRENMLDPDLHKIGICYTPGSGVWTTVFSD